MGDRIDTKNLSVYFLDEVPKEKALEFARFWKSNGFIGTKKQTIQLEKKERQIIVKLIENEEFHSDHLTITEEALLQDLERELSKEVFHVKTKILITDNTFRPILKK
ncbi:hypothetical protein CW751_12210 [Brumimicrobium salinarum]|uniref:Uncharacterized protein n=2 Tax=Brumimicrobium salinarum TaxID=2058658 RepID=A0A2I0R058_9FLAO|nr:hypothetical protein CW751_12210 [Brumimicrobium salinarum]